MVYPDSARQPCQGRGTTYNAIPMRPAGLLILIGGRVFASEVDSMHQGPQVWTQQNHLKSGS